MKEWLKDNIGWLFDWSLDISNVMLMPLRIIVWGIIMVIVITIIINLFN